MGVKNVVHVMGESTDFCGTPYFIGCWIDEIKLSILIEKRLFNKNFLNHKRDIDLVLYFAICLL